MRRLGMVFAAGLMIGLSIYLGVRAAADPSFVIWFGLATAVLAPAAFQMLSLAALPGDRQLLRRLSAVPQMAELMARAQSEQDKVRVLEEERARLEEIIRVEARREALVQRRDRLLDDATRILEDLDAIEAESASLAEDLGSNEAVPEIEALRERLSARRRGELVLSFRGRDYVVDPDIFAFAPFLPRALVVAAIRALRRRSS